MAFLLKVRWEIKPGMQTQFCESADVLDVSVQNEVTDAAPPVKRRSGPPFQ